MYIRGITLDGRYTPELHGRLGEHNLKTETELILRTHSSSKLYPQAPTYQTFVAVMVVSVVVKRSQMAGQWLDLVSMRVCPEALNRC